MKTVRLQVTSRIGFFNKLAITNVLFALGLPAIIGAVVAKKNVQFHFLSSAILILVLLLLRVAGYYLSTYAIYKSNAGFILIDETQATISCGEIQDIIPVQDILLLIANFHDDIVHEKSTALDWGNTIQVLSKGQKISFYLEKLTTQSVKTLRSFGVTNLKRKASWLMMTPGQMLNIYSDLRL